MTTIPRLPPLPGIRDMVKLYKVSAMKQLSQNFILNEKLTDKIVKKAGNLTGAEVLEVGPGPGGLTRSIIRQCPEKLIVIEKDRRFKPILQMLSDAYSTVNGKMDIIYGDIMRTNLTPLFSESFKKSWEDKMPRIFIIGNLPFNVSTPLIIQWLHSISERNGPWEFGRSRMTLTFQKEVAERLVAEPLDDQRCRLSVMAQAWTKPVLHFIIQGSAFVPKPDVDVGVVSFIPLANPRTKHEFKIFERVTRHIFSFRQKYSVRGIETLFPPECRKECGHMMYKLTDLNPQTRPMELSVEDIDKLVSAYKYLIEKHPEIGVYEYRASRKILKLSDTIKIDVAECSTL
ncbi:PREDICTED: dimethyladenosine transferase 1, mitochondrial [Dufourea novaeangliae]|uniref:rRNA adenine N(6)-methyltransferase n=1 Tax=Dufourea novaeangliae TaxID=178035 RepID=A0A154PPD3_DUFNO|nr:PREDICTED: dimethyladenosine transferase 1, mitochondrial [Dufourea novaeangliae]KZC13118.1 Dimethyladenosine transferase 1, mitochondrial [Dufourea novaeangliae]